METPELPAGVKRVLDDFVEAAARGFGTALRSVVLFGSAAEGRLRATSDVNVILVLSAFEQATADQIREAVRLAEAAIQLRPMFLLESEIGEAARAFAQKFSDVLRRRQVLYGEDPFPSVRIPREVELANLRQHLLNLILRLRAAYVTRSLREEQLALVIADAAAPLRSAAAALMELEGRPAESPKQALERVAEALGVAGWQALLERMSQARETRSLAVGAGGETLFGLLDLARRMRDRAQALS